MADLGYTVNVDELPDGQDFSPMPLGKYPAVLTNSKLVPTKKTIELMSASGVSDYDVFRKSNPRAEGYLALEFDIQDSQYAGRKLFHNLNLINDNAQAVEIAAAQLKQILLAFGMKTFSGKSEELHNKRLILDVKVEPPKPYAKNGVQHEGIPQNKITKFSAATSISATSGTSTISSSTPAVQSGTVQKSPWARG